MLNLFGRGALCRGQRSQMKQIKGEPWPPGETLAGSRDGIQMGNREGIVQQFWVPLFFFPPNNNLIIIKVCCFVFFS